jgi:prepilin-type N-terminal cleavage/methylation domain-containing protein
MRARGFTLIEILLSVALIGILAGLSLPVYQAFQVKNDLSVAVDTVVQSMRRAQMLSRASQGMRTAPQ